jgi:hypothetical protein
MNRSVPGSLVGKSDKQQTGSGLSFSPVSWSTTGPRATARPQTAQGSVSSNPSTPMSGAHTNFACARSSIDDASSSRGRASLSSSLGVSRTAASPRARSTSPDRSPTWSEEAAREGAKVALQKYRAAFELMRLRDKSRSCSGWTDDDSPTRNKPTAFKDSACASNNTENEA